MSERMPSNAVHAAFGEEMVDDLPVRGIPADEEEFRGFRGFF